MSAELVERLLGHWKSWGSPTDRDAEVNEGVMAIDCKEAADALAASEKRVAELEAEIERRSPKPREPYTSHKGWRSEGAVEPESGPFFDAEGKETPNAD